MKKMLFTAAMLMLSSVSFAQFSNSTSSSSSDVNTDGWSTIWVEYNPTSIKYDTKGVDDETATGFSLGYSKAFPITQSTPLFLEAGLGAQYTFNTNDDAIIKYTYGNNNSYSTKGEIKTTLISAKIPVNLIYAYQIPNSTVAILPFIGANLRFNIIGKQKYSFDGDDAFDSDDLEKDVFDKKDMGSSDATWNRFQVGWHIGLKARFGENLLIGLSYGNDFSELAKKVKISTTSIILGYTF